MAIDTIEVTYISEELADEVIDAIEQSTPIGATCFDGTFDLSHGRFTRLEQMLKPLNIEVLHTGGKQAASSLIKHWHCADCGVSLLYTERCLICYWGD
jgi:hypothetical protein